jgi:hypothetical protein
MSKYDGIPQRDKTLSIHLQPEEKAMYAATADRLGVPTSAFGRLLLRTGYKAIARDPTLLTEVMV